MGHLLLLVKIPMGPGILQLILHIIVIRLTLKLLLRLLPIKLLGLVIFI